MVFIGGEPMHAHCVDEMNCLEDDIDGEFEDDGQPTEYEEWQDLYGGDDMFEYNNFYPDYGDE